MKIVQPSPDDWKNYRDFILQALQSKPNYLASSYQVAQTKSDQSWKNDLKEAVAQNAYFMRFAYDDDVLAGTIKIRLQEPGCCFEHVGNLGPLYVSPIYRRQGIATQLVQDVLNVAPQHGIETILTYIRTDNQASLELFHSLGFETRGTLRRTAKTEFGYEDEQILQLHLA